MTEEQPEDERDIELSSITAIFPELVVDPNNSNSATLDVPVAPSKPVKIDFKRPPVLNLATKTANGLPTPPQSDSGIHATLLDTPPSTVHDTVSLSHLPPLHLNISLPDGYPDEKPPSFSLSCSPNWLPTGILDKLNRAGETLWEEYGRTQIVYVYIDFLQQEADQCFGLTDNELKLAYELKIPLVTFNKRTLRQKFDQETFECGVCLEPKKGSMCYRLRRCGHVFCISCLQDFYNSAITEGDVSTVKCLDPDCGMQGLNQEQRRRKKPYTLHPIELLDIPIEREQVQRYVDLKIRKIIESDKNTIYCPRKWCQGPVLSEKYAKLSSHELEDFPDVDLSHENEEDKPSDSMVHPPEFERIAICSKCRYAFCRVCTKTWHGDFVVCRPQNAAAVTEEDQASYDFIRMYTSPCPTCSVPCQKTHGCNHIRCFQCDTHFCYLCSSWLSAQDPYKHFNTKGTMCYMKLWELEEGDEGPQNRNQGMFAGVRAAEIAYQGPQENQPQQNEPPPDQDHRRGLQRFLEMAANDEEDGWDSDELEMGHWVEL